MLTQACQTSKQGFSYRDGFHFARLLTAKAPDAQFLVDLGLAVDEFNRFRRADHGAFSAANAQLGDPVRSDWPRSHTVSVPTILAMGCCGRGCRVERNGRG
jgi:hypothetical protein